MSGVKGKTGVYKHKPNQLFQLGNKIGVGRKAWNKGLSNHWCKGSKNVNWKGGITVGDNLKKARVFYQRRRIVRKIGNGGSHSIKEWESLLRVYNWSCACCKKGMTETKLTEDHITPLSRGGNDNIENIQPLCMQCNRKKYMEIIKY